MSTGGESAPGRLTEEELSRLRDFLAQSDADSWDRQFEEDVEAGRLEKLADQAIEDLCAGRCTEL